jgi:hypothetical protein
MRRAPADRCSTDEALAELERLIMQLPQAAAAASAAAKK